jgi:hypothetical protein
MYLLLFNQILIKLFSVPVSRLLYFTFVLQIFAMDIGGSLTKIAYYSVLPLKKIVYDGVADPGEQIEVR